MDPTHEDYDDAIGRYLAYLRGRLLLMRLWVSGSELFLLKAIEFDKTYREEPGVIECDCHMKEQENLFDEFLESEKELTANSPSIPDFDKNGEIL